MTSPRETISPNSARENDRVPENGQTPRPSDTEVRRTDGPDPDLHTEAAASTEADAEAGAAPEDGGGITPLKRR